MSNNFFVSCVESRMEQETSWYSRFEIGPFPKGQALTVANSLRRTLLSEQHGVFLTAVEIDGAIHEYSRLEGVKESVLDILLNLRQLSLISNIENDEQGLDLQTSKTFIGYFDLQGPMDVKAKDLTFPKQIECCNPNQHLVTLTRNANFQGRFLIMMNPSNQLSTHAIGDPVSVSNLIAKNSNHNSLFTKNWLYVNPITNAIRRVNYVVEQFGDLWEQKEVVILELWTNGTVYPKHAIQKACLNLSNVFSALSIFNNSSFRVNNSLSRFKKAKQTSSIEVNTFSKSDVTSFSETNTDKLALLFDLDIGNLNLSIKTYLQLKQAKIDNIGNLLQYKKQDLSRFVTLSQKQLEEIDYSLNIFGLSF